MLMLRPALFAAAVVALVAPVRAADPDLSGNWLLSYSPRAGSDQNVAIVKVEMKDGKPAASVVAVPGKGTPAAAPTLTVDGKTVKLTLTAGGPWFEGTIGADGKVVLGNFGTDQLVYRATLARTDKTALAEAVTRTDAPAGAAAELQKLTTNLNDLRLQFAREPDPVKKANELTEKVNAAQKELDEKQPELLRAVVAKNPDTPFGIDAAVDLLRGAARFKLTPDEATKALAVVEKGVAPFGTRYARMTTLSAVETLANTKGLEATAVAAAEKLQKA